MRCALRARRRSASGSLNLPTDGAFTVLDSERHLTRRPSVDLRRMAENAPATALLRGLRRAGYEPQLTQVLASVFQAEPAMAAGFARLLLDELQPALADAIPDELTCVAE